MSKLKKPILLVLAIIICLTMIRLGIWQLDRADQNQAILDQQQASLAQTTVGLSSLIAELQIEPAQLRHRPVSATGRYNADKSIYLDNQVVEGQVGYKLLTPMRLNQSDWWVLIDRGWLPVGDSRAVLPEVETQNGQHKVQGYLQLPASAPPLWKEEYSVSNGAVWQYLPMPEIAAQLQLKLLPLVLELAPEQAAELDATLVRKPIRLDESAVAKNKGYAFQWFAMALAFFIACLILLLRSLKPKNNS